MNVSSPVKKFTSHFMGACFFYLQLICRLVFYGLSAFDEGMFKKKTAAPGTAVFLNNELTKFLKKLN
jgi:hypothetical protein